MKIEITNEHFVSSRISKDFTITIDGDVELEFNKWSSEDDNNTEWDYEFEPESKKVFDKLSEERQEAITEFILDVKL